MMKDKHVLVVGSMRTGIGKGVGLLLREALEVPDSMIFRNDTHATQRFASMDDRNKIDPRHNKKPQPHKTILRNHRK